MIKRSQSQVFTILKAILGACNSAVNILALPGSLTWALTLLDVAAAATLFSVFDPSVTLSPPTSEAGVRSPSWPEVGKLVVACRWSAVYSTEP